METFEQMALRVAEECDALAEEKETEAEWVFDFATRLRDELCKGQEPVAWMFANVYAKAPPREDLKEFWTPLYLHPAPIPADMVLVPREPTKAMIYAADDADCRDARWPEIYDAMIAAYEKEQGK